MGLADRKSKQRIGTDPRNLAWKNDASRFGHAYLAKHGWDPTSGLGLEGQGMQDYLRVAHKLDALGIGAKVGGKEERDGQAGREFERMLRRLNESLGAAEENGDVSMEESVVVKATSEEILVVERSEVETVAVAAEKVKKKQKAQVDKAKGTGPDGRGDGTETTIVSMESEAIVSSAIAVAAALPPSLPSRLAHRSRFLRMKSMVKSDSRGVSEILGISASSTPISSELESPSSPFPSAFPTVSLATSGTQTPEETKDDTIKVSTSSMSVADYFKEKMKRKLGLVSQDGGHDSSTVTNSITTPRRGLGFKGPEPVESTVTSDVPDTPGHAFSAPHSVQELAALPRKKRKTVELEDPEMSEVSALLADDDSALTRKKKRRIVPSEGEPLEADGGASTQSAPTAEVQKKKKKKIVVPVDGMVAEFEPSKKKPKAAPGESAERDDIDERAERAAASPVASDGVEIEGIAKSREAEKGKREKRRKVP